jgi:multiple sugar transport system permease protein/raffinose/stachyose/melibiose transport system permease protein
MSKSQKTLYFVKIYFLAFVLATFVLFPIMVMVSMSLKAPDEQFTSPPYLVPKRPTLSNYLHVIGRGSMFLRYFLNSLLVAAASTVIVLGVALFSSYSYARLRFPGRDFFFILILLSQLFPLAAIIVSLYRIMSQLRMIDTYWSLIVAYLTFSVPVGVWLLRNFFLGIPKELEEAAMIDGCTRFMAFWKIVVPLIRPGLGATFAYLFFVTWQEFMFALTFITSEAKRTLPVGIFDYVGQYETNWGNLMAASSLICVPVFLLFLFVQQQLVGGLTRGAVKG